MIELPPGTRIWIAAGVTDMRRGFQGLSAQVQLQLQPLSGHVFAFRGRRGDTIFGMTAMACVCLPSGSNATALYGHK